MHQTKIPYKIVSLIYMKQSLNHMEKCFNDFVAALEELTALSKEVKRKEENEKVEQKMIRSFEITHELALKCMVEYFRKEGRSQYTGPRDTTMDAFHEELIDDGVGWLDMIIIRIKTTPIYHENTTNLLVEKIRSQFIKLFQTFKTNMKKRIADQ